MCYSSFHFFGFFINSNAPTFIINAMVYTINRKNRSESLQAKTRNTRGPSEQRTWQRDWHPLIFWGFSLVNSALPNYPLSSHEDMASEISQFVQFQRFIILPVFSSYKTNPHLAVHQPYTCSVWRYVKKNGPCEYFCYTLIL